MLKGALLVFQLLLNDVSMATMRMQQYAKDRRVWETKHLSAFPGRQWGIELNCTHPFESFENQSRVQHARFWIEEIIKPNRMGFPIWGLEVGACNMPVRFKERQIRVQYLDFAGKDNDHCFNKGQIVQANIIDDAQTMLAVQAESFDFIMGYHVLEHLPDFFGAIKAWIRSIKRGGLLIFALPSPCDQKWNHGESLRFVTDPSHFASEYERPTRTQGNSLEHMREAALAIWGMQEESNPRLRPPPAISKRLDMCTKMLRASKRWLNFTSKYAIDVVQLPQIPLEDIQCLVENLLKDDPNRAHLHVWSLYSLRKALVMAQNVMPSAYQFDIISAAVAARGAFNMEEFRVVLRRQRPRAVTNI